MESPVGTARRPAVAAALGGEGRRTPRVDDDAGRRAARVSPCGCATCSSASRAATSAAPYALLNALLLDTGARPQLDRLPDGAVGTCTSTASDDSLATGWAAGCATGLALAIGSDLAGRLGVCAADRCDRVFVDTSRNATRRFCSTACQNRTKAAAFRARAGG